MALAVSALVALPLVRALQSQLGINIEHSLFIYDSYIMSGALITLTSMVVSTGLLGGCTKCTWLLWLAVLAGSKHFEIETEVYSEDTKFQWWFWYCPGLVWWFYKVSICGSPYAGTEPQVICAEGPYPVRI